MRGTVKAVIALSQSERNRKEDKARVNKTKLKTTNHSSEKPHTHEKKFNAVQIIPMGAVISIPYNE